MDAVCTQAAVRGDTALAHRLCESGSVLEFHAGNDLVVQGASDNDLYFVISGRVAVLVRNRELAVRGSGQHVGEMAVVDPTARRSATVRALEPTVALKVSEDAFSRIAAEHPDLWRRIAIELGHRLRERTKHVRPPNERPVVFIGSSVEGLHIAEQIQAGLGHVDAVVKIWSNNVFTASRGTIEALEQVVASADFGVFVFSPDDRVVNEQREIDRRAPRDNVILELGMCLGVLGRDRTFFALPRGADLKIPTDLLGVTPLDYRADDPENLAAHLGPVCTSIKAAIQSRPTLTETRWH